MWKKVGCVFLSVVVVMGFFYIAVRPTTANAAINLKLAHVVNTKDAFHICALKFKELVEKDTNGEVTITIYPNRQLGDEKTILERMRMGIIDLGTITTGPIINFLPIYGVLDLPFLFRSPHEAYKILDGKIGQKLLGYMDKVGWVGLAFGERGFRNLTNSKRPVVEPKDIKGLKIRVMQNKIYVDTFKTLGANAVPMAWGEVLTALQQGTVDGQENPLNVLVAFKLYETQKYLSLTRHAYAPMVIMASKKVWEQKIPTKYHEIIRKDAYKAAMYERNWDQSHAKEWLQFLKDKGMKVSHPDIPAFRKAVKPVYDKYGPQFKDVLPAILTAERE